MGEEARLLGYNNSTCGWIGCGSDISMGLAGYTSLSLTLDGDVKEKIGVDILLGE